MSARFRTAAVRPATTVAPCPLVLCLLVLCLLALAGCTSTGADEQTRSAGQTGYVGVERNVTSIPVAARQAVPTIAGPEVGGAATLSSAAYTGKVVVLNVWGSWCGPCRSEAPDLQGASEETKNLAQFVGVNTKDLDPAPAVAFARVNKITYPSIYDPSGQLLLNFAGILPPSAIPSTMVIDAKGRLAVRILGPISKITLVDIVEDVAAGR